MTRALDRRDTAEALERYRQRAAGWVGAGFALAAPTWVLMALSTDVQEPGWFEQLLPGLLGMGTFLFLLGLGALRLARRMRRVLSAGDWSAHPVVVPVRGRPVLRAGGRDELWPLTVVAVEHRWKRVVPGPTGTVWWCGDPRTGGVIAPPGGGELIWAKPVRGQLTRRRVLRRAEETALLPATASAQPAAGEAHTASAAEGRARTPRRRGLGRWVVLVSAVVLGLGIYGSEAAEHDPLIDLTVVSEESDGSCVVRWTDPWTHQERTGPYRCDGERDPLLHDWETGWLVSYGPWKGDLYTSDWWGTPANEVNDALFACGALGVLAGAVGGGIGWMRRRPRRRHVAMTPWPFVGPPVSLVKRGDGSAAAYARLVAAVKREVQPRAPARRPEADVRSVPWWRVRALAVLAGLPPVLGALVGVVAAIVLWWLDPAAGAFPVVVGVVWAGALCVYAYRLLTAGRPAALMLARAARAPVPVPKRYVLLYDPYGGAPVLVVFPAHGGPGDRPEGLLPLFPSAAPPARPFGETELRGWLDGVADGRPVVVAWADGRALWPGGPYLEAGTAEFAAVLDRLVSVLGTAEGVPPQDPEDAARSSL